MPIICKKDNYEITQINDKYYAYNSLYLENPKHVVLQAAFEAILPDPTSFHIPLIIGFKPNENEEAIINKSLHVTNATEVEYYMVKDHFRLWKLSYLLLNILVIIGTIFLSSGMIWIYVCLDNLNKVLLAGIIILYLYLAFLLVKLIRQLKLMRKKDVKIVDFKI